MLKQQQQQQKPILKTPDQIAKMRDAGKVVAEALQTDVASLLMRNPAQAEAIWSIWDQAKPAEREQIIAIAQALKRTGT